MNSLRSIKNDFKKGGHDKSFVPTASNVHKRMAPIPEYKIQGVITPKPKRNEETKEIDLEPHNMKVSPMKKGKHDKGSKIYFGGNIPYMEDDYNIKKKIAKDDLDYHNSKIQDKAFRPLVGKVDHFFSHKKMYMEDPPMPPKIIKEKPKVELETAFKPAGTNKKQVAPTFSKYPEYMPSPPREVKRQ